MLKFNPISGISTASYMHNLKKEQSKLEAVTVLPFFQQYGRRDVILPTTSL